MLRTSSPTLQKLSPWLEKAGFRKLAEWAQGLLTLKIIFDIEPKLYSGSVREAGFSFDLKKNEICRHLIFGRSGTRQLQFLEIGGGDGRLTYLLGKDEKDPFMKKTKSASTRSSSTLPSISSLVRRTFWLLIFAPKIFLRNLRIGLARLMWFIPTMFLSI